MINMKPAFIGVALLSAVLATGCSSSYKPPQVGDQLIWTSDDEEKRPMWTLTGEVEANRRAQTMRFVGMSNRHSTQKGARDAAMDDARRQIANYAQTVVDDVVKRMEEGGDLQSNIQDPAQRLSRVTTQVSHLAVRRMKAEDWRFEQWSDNEKGTFYKAFVRVEVPQSVLDVPEEIVQDALMASGE